jgi:hypothetical protein
MREISGGLHDSGFYMKGTTSTLAGPFSCPFGILMMAIAATWVITGLAMVAEAAHESRTRHPTTFLSR